MLMPRRQATTMDIALETELSRPVVSAILNNRKKPYMRYSDNTRTRVLAAAEKLGYRPNRSALNLKNRRHNAIGIYAGHSIYNIHDRTLNQMIHLSRNNKLNTVIETNNPAENIMPISLLEHSVDGIIVFQDMPMVENEIEKAGLPVVFVNTNQNNGANCITYAEVDGMKSGLKHLRENGIGKTGYICSKEQMRHYSAKIRLATFQSHAGEGSCLLILDSSIDAEKGRKNTFRQMKSFLMQNPGIDGIILSADIFAPLFYHAAHSMNLRIPQDMSLIAYNDTGISRLLQPEVTALTVDYPKLAEKSLSMLMKIMNGKAPGGPLMVKYDIVKRSSG